MSARVSRRAFLRRAGRVATTSPLLGLVACALDAPPARATVLRGPTMGTTYRVTLPPSSGASDGRALHAEVGAVLARVDARMSTYRPDAELARFNAAATTAWVDVTEETLSVIERALEIARRSGGAFDPTVGPLVDLWGFGPAPRTGRPPSEAAIAALLPAVGADGIETRRDPPQVRKLRPYVRLDLSGIAKGHGLDQVAALLDDRGVASYLIDVGGELRARGERAPGEPWRIGIERPVPGAREVLTTLTLGAPGLTEGLATSGDYRQFFEADGRRFCHLLDPRRGAPVTHDLAAASVVAATDAEADAWATALMVLGPDAGMACARAHGLAALLVVRDGAALRLARTPALDARTDGGRSPG